MKNLIAIFKRIVLLLFISLSAKAQTYQWAKSFNCTKYAYSFGVVADVSGNVYTVGKFTGQVDLDPGAGTYFAGDSMSSSGHCFVSKLDINGNLVWAVAFGGDSLSAASGQSIALDNNGNILISGSFTGICDVNPGNGIYNLTSGGNDDIFVLKLNNSGNFIWAKSFWGTLTSGTRATIKVDNSGNVYTTGPFIGAVDFDPGPGFYVLTTPPFFNNMFISKLDSMGNFVWAKNFDSVDGLGGRITLDNATNIYIAGGFKDTVDFDPSAGSAIAIGTHNGSAFICKLDTGGNFVWVRTWGTKGENTANAAVDAQKNVYVTGWFSDTTDFDPGTGIVSLIPNGPWTSGRDAYISKFDSTGNFIWVNAIAGHSLDGGSAINIDTDGNIYTTGYFTDSADFDPGPNTYYLHGAGPSSNTIYLCKWDSAANFIWAKALGNYNYSTESDDLCTDANNVYLTGSFGGTVDFDPPNMANLTAYVTHVSAYVVKYSQNVAGIEKEFNKADITVYPNPASKHLFINYPRPTFKTIKIKLYDLFGKIILTTEKKQGESVIDISTLANGMYLLSVDNGITIETRKLIISH